MDIMKLSAIGILTAFCVIILRETRSEMAMLIGVAGGLLMLLMVAEGVLSIFAVVEGIVAKSGISNVIFSCIIKIVGIGYITDFSAGICEDCGCKSIGDKIILGGKVIIMLLALPIISTLFETIYGILQ